MGFVDIGGQVGMQSITSLRKWRRSELTVSRLTKVENTGTGSLVLFTAISRRSMRAAEQRTNIAPVAAIIETQGPNTDEKYDTSSKPIR